MKTRKTILKIIPILLILLFGLIMIISPATIVRMQGNARIINYTGIVRGMTQRIVKQEINGVENDHLIHEIDEILADLSRGDGINGLVVLPDKTYQNLILQMSRDWTGIKKEIMQVRTGAEASHLYELSELYFDLANQAVSVAEFYSEKQVKNAKVILICLNVCFILLTILLWFYNQRQKKVEMALKMAEHASKAKSEFMSCMSHEIRTPLNGIIGMTNVAHMYLKDPIKLKDCLKKIDLSSRYLLSIINDILDMARIESGKMELEYHEFDIKNVIDQIYSMFQQKAEDNGISFTTKYNTLSVSYVTGDDVRLSQVLVNIVSNALKFTPKGGQVTLEAVQTEVREQEISLEFIISDTGIGMSEEFQARVFSPFEQEVTGRQYGGTGLGLTISSNFIKMMGGKISVSSKLGEGSQFKVSLTMQRSLEKKTTVLENLENNQDSKGITACDLAGAKVLLAEDNEMNAEIVTVILEKHGVSVKTAVNGKEAVELFQTSKKGDYTVILMDIQMPVMDGLEASRIIRKLNIADAKTIPIIGLSANVFREDVEKAMESGMNGYLYKPIDMQKLLEAVSRNAFTQI